MKTIVITSGYFNPLHPGHLECLELCKELGDELWVIVNNDQQVRLKTGKEEVFQDEQFRLRIVSALKPVDQVFLSVDQDGSVCESIRTVVKQVRELYGDEVQIIFGKGGDRFAGNIPEVKVCEELGIMIRDGLGAKTHNSSEYRGKVG
jgi:cytidyltransferase-like protein